VVGSMKDQSSYLNDNEHGEDTFWAMQKLMQELELGRRSGEDQGYVNAEDVFSELEKRYENELCIK